MKLKTACILLLAVTLIFCSPSIAKQASDFSLKDIQGENISLSSQLKNKDVLLVFWTTWCPYCIKEIPLLNKLQKNYSDKLSILAVNIRQNPKTIKKFAQKKGLFYKILLDTEGSVAKLYSVFGIPDNLLIAKETGEIITRTHDINQIDDALKNK